jgi:chaperonin GroEL
MKALFLEDIAAMTGGKVFPMGAKPQDFNVDILGGADKVVVKADSTTIIGAQAPEEDKNARLEALRAELKDTENSTDISFIKDRLSKLQGKVAIVRVGGATPVERDEVKLRVEDAIAAVQSAIKDGVVPGGGVCLARLAPQDFAEAFQAPFRQLVSNAGFNPEQALFKVLEQDNAWMGYDLRSKFELVNLLEVGILDPAEVIKEVVRNSASVVSQLITAKVSLTFENREMVA